MGVIDDQRIAVRRYRQTTPAERQEVSYSMEKEKKRQGTKEREPTCRRN
jgi:hypothetical protein